MGHTSESSWVPSVTLLVGVGSEGISALLLGADGRVRGDADMVFEGQPVHPSGAVRHTKRSLSLALHEVEPEVERIVIAGPAVSGSLAAMAPDRQVVVAWLIARPDDAKAVVFGEFFRESGGWKFTGIGKGYASGLAELVTAYGVEVAEEEPVAEPVAPPAAGPVPLTSVAKVPPTHAPSPYRKHHGTPVAAGVAGTPDVPGLPAFPPVERKHRSAEGWDFGPVFEPFTVTGRANDVITADSRVPAGPVLVELAHKGGGYVGLNPLDERNKSQRYIFNSTLPDFRGSRVTLAPEGRPLRMRLQADNEWTLRVRPVAAARRLEGTIRGYCFEALLYTGGPADLQVDFEGDPETNGGYIGINGYEVAGQTDLTGPHTLVLNSPDGKGRHTVPIPAGPMLLLLQADGPWTLTVRETGF
ncbi:TerD family protein [Streptomyces sp. Root431]|uniref:TerD family protein n=1 Tax=Streptomyces sp. Root431 TaxID=1736535 RepID=UPI001F5B70D1|nr:TerD family protein [Streptomyces sp. Root431]